MLVLACLSCIGAAVPEAAETIAIYGVVIDGTGGDPIPGGVVVVSGDRIVAIGFAAEIVIPEGAREVRIADATVLPGIIDTHVHQAYDAWTLAQWAESGVTTVRDLGADPNMDWDRVRDGFAEDLTLATLIVSGPLVTVPDGYGVTHGFPVAVTASSSAEARNITDGLICDGVDIIKIAIDSSMPHDFDAVMSLDVTQAIVDTAHEQGQSVVAHISNEADVLLAIEAGVDQIAHTGTGSRRIATLQSLVDHGIIWVTTLFNPSGSAHLKNFFERGGIVAMGTDRGAMGRVDASMPVEQFQRMMRSGMDAMSVIVASTRNAALACGIEDEVGTLEIGKFADLLVVAGDPLGDITVLGDAVFVMHHGTVVHDEVGAD